MHMMKRFLLVIFACIALTAQAQDNTQVLRFGYLSYEAALKAMPENAAVLMKMDSLRSAFQE
jgi:outer membrane protein